VKTVAVVQARLGSERLPGKVLADICGRPALERVVTRVRRCALVDKVIVATSDGPADDAIVAECARIGVECFRGSEDDVLGRFDAAAERFDADVCVRITADCPLLDPGVSNDIIAQFHEASPAVSYASNKIPQSFPRGLDTEVFTREALARAAREASLDYERAHVTPYIYNHPETFTVLSVTSGVDRAAWRWTVDTPEDLEFVREVYARFSPRDDFTWLEVVDLLEEVPELMTINAGVRQKEVEEG
jgi:spore coat polysaccharide biosynthesis protein SpsF